jgi:predicted protein tyrosine phosphatase
MERGIKFTTIQTDNIEGIIGEEILLLVDEEKFKDVDFSDIVLISIKDPNDTTIDFSEVQKRFKKFIALEFWDIEEDIGAKANGMPVKPINTKQAEQIAQFIVDNKNEKFMIHCIAGQSRSAGVAVALDTIINFNGSSKARSMRPCIIHQHWRYDPNPKVIKMVISAFFSLGLDDKNLINCTNCDTIIKQPLISTKDGNRTDLCPECFHDL